MAKQKKKQSKKASSAHAGEVKAGKKPVKWQRLLTLVLSTLAAFALFEAVISLEAKAGLSFSIITIVYYVIITVLLLVILFLNRGFSKQELTPDMLDEGTPPEEAARICETVNRQKQYAKRLMTVLFPFVFAVFLDIIYLFYGDMLASVFSYLA